LRKKSKQKTSEKGRKKKKILERKKGLTANLTPAENVGLGKTGYFRSDCPEEKGNAV